MNITGFLQPTRLVDHLRLFAIKQVQEVRRKYYSMSGGQILKGKALQLWYSAISPIVEPLRSKVEPFGHGRGTDPIDQFAMMMTVIGHAPCVHAVLMRSNPIR